MDRSLTYMLCSTFTNQLYLPTQFASNILPLQVLYRFRCNSYGVQSFLTPKSFQTLQIPLHATLKLKRYVRTELSFFIEITFGGHTYQDFRHAQARIDILEHDVKDRVWTVQIACPCDTQGLQRCMLGGVVGIRFWLPCLRFFLTLAWRRWPRP